MNKAAYFLGQSYFDSIYSHAERNEISRFVDIQNVLLTPENWRRNAELAAQTELLFSGWGMAVLDEELLSCFPKLKAVFYAGGTIKNIVTDAFWSRDIIISSAAQANAIPVAEFTIAQIVLAAKHVWNIAAGVKRLGAYPPRHEQPGMYGITIGLISFGAIAKLVARRLRSFDVSVIAYDPIVQKCEADALGVRLVSLDEVFSQSNIVSCHAPLLNETVGMVNRDHFVKMKQDAVFINTARGALVRESDLISVLQERSDLSAMLDVTFPEPPNRNSPLYTLPNVVLTPHLAGSMGNECYRMGKFMVDDARRYVSGLPLQYQITHEQVSIMA